MLIPQILDKTKHGCEVAKMPIYLLACKSAVLNYRALVAVSGQAAENSSLCDPQGKFTDDIVKICRHLR